MRDFFNFVSYIEYTENTTTQKTRSQSLRVWASPVVKENRVSAVHP